MFRSAGSSFDCDALEHHKVTLAMRASGHTHGVAFSLLQRTFAIRCFQPQRHLNCHRPDLRILCMQAVTRSLVINAAESSPVVTVSGLSKTYANGFKALKHVDLTIHRGEIFALLGPNGAGKTTLINIICGIVRPSAGTVVADGHDIVRDYRAARSKIGLVPQELHTDAFESVRATVKFSRGLFGKPPSPAYIEKVLRDLALWDKKDGKIMTLSGGMKRRVLIAKALSHQPQILFLDEPTAGVDVELRRDMWRMVRGLRENGVTIILTTHYIEEAEEMADRIGVINKGELIVVEDKAVLMRKLGKKQLTLQLRSRLAQIPAELAGYPLELTSDGHLLVFTFDTQTGETGIANLLKRLGELGIDFKDLHSSESSLEEIFVNLVRRQA
jgi:ABC-2 type transport system ATP-binding protein